MKMLADMRRIEGESMKKKKKEEEEEEEEEEDSFYARVNAQV